MEKFVTLMLLAQIPVFDPKSDQAKSISDLFIVTLGIGFLIILLVVVLVTVAIIKFRPSKSEDGNKSEPKQVHGNRKWEIGWTLAPAALLAVLFVPTFIVMGASDPGVNEAQGQQPDIEIIGHQFWWEYRYPKDGLVTADELHLPVGQKVLARLQSADVIHDFWVPELGRKMDAIPGKPNQLWLEADQMGLYNGACSEYCGASHAWMLIKVVVQSQADFDAWKASQKVIPSTPPTGSQAAQGQALFDKYSCSSCHSIAGTNAKGQVGPNLTHVAERSILGSGAIKNSPENLYKWIQDAPAIKPGAKMPDYQQLRDDELQALVAYLEGLK